MAAIEDRLDRLEKVQKRRRIFIFCLFAIGLCGVAMAQQGVNGRLAPLIPRIMEAIKNDQLVPTEFLEIGATKQAFNVIRATEIQIATATGQVVGVFGADGNRGTFAILNRFGSPILAFGENDDGNGSMNVFNSAGRRVGIISVDSNGHGGIDAYNKDGGRVSGLGVDKSGNGAVNVFNKDGGVAGIFAVNPLGAGAVEVYNQGGHQVGVLGVSDAGDGVLYINDKSGAFKWDPFQSGQTSSGLQGDLDQDGDVDFSDFLTFAQNYGKKQG